MLLNHYSTEYLSEVLLSHKDYKPFPTIEERDKWDGLPNSLKEFWVTKGESKLNYSWPSISATLYMDYSRTGNRTRYDTVSWDRRNDLASLVIAECIENQGRFIDDIRSPLYSRIGMGAGLEMPSCVNWEPRN